MLVIWVIALEIFWVFVFIYFSFRTIETELAWMVPKFSPMKAEWFLSLARPTCSNGDSYNTRNKEVRKSRDKQRPLNTAESKPKNHSFSAAFEKSERLAEGLKRRAESNSFHNLWCEK